MHADLEQHVYESPGDILRSNTFGCNCLEDNPAYQSKTFNYCILMLNITSLLLTVPFSKSEEANKMLECNYAIIPEFHSSGKLEPCMHALIVKHIFLCFHRLQLRILHVIKLLGCM